METVTFGAFITASIAILNTLKRLEPRTASRPVKNNFRHYRSGRPVKHTGFLYELIHHALSARHIILIFVACTAISSANAQDRCEQAVDKPTGAAVNIAVLHRNDANGKSLWEAIVAACKEFGCDTAPKIAITSCGYDMEPDGFRTLQREIIENEADRYQLVLGPSDSGVMLRAREVLKLGNGKDIPIISPVVIAAGGKSDSQ